MPTEPADNARDTRRIMVALGKIEVAVEALRAENLFGQKQHEDFEHRIRGLEAEENQGPDHEVRIRALERFRWVLYGAVGAVAAGTGAGLAQILGG